MFGGKSAKFLEIIKPLRKELF